MERVIASKYEIVAPIGHGGMADVHLAVFHGPHGFDKLIVIKEVRPAFAGDPAFHRMFVDEARLAGRLSHPNIVQTVEVGSTEAGTFIAMEYLDGQPLHLVLREMAEGRMAPLPIALRVRIAAEALAGLDYAHKFVDYDGTPLDIVHRDVSPQNIFITYDGQVKLVDFGIAKAAARISDETEIGIVKGKRAYMSPEQARGGAVDARADVFAMGIVLWELLALRRLPAPVPESEATVKDASSKGDLKPPLRMSRTVPRLAEVAPDAEELQHVVDRALAMRIEDRYATAAEMREDLEPYLAKAVPRPRRDQLGGAVAHAFSKARADRLEKIRPHMRSLESDGRDVPNSFPPMPARPRLASSSRPPPHRDDSASTLQSKDEATDANSASTKVERANSSKASAISEASRDADAQPWGSGPMRMRGVPMSRIAMIGGACALVLLGGVVVSQRRNDVSPTTPAEAADAAATMDAAIRMCGSFSIGQEIGPELISAFVKGKIAKTPERAVTTTLAEKTSSQTKTLVSGLPEGPVEILAHSTSGGFERLAGGTCDVAMASRAIKPEEVDRARAAKQSVSEHVFGMEAIAVIVHPSGALERSIDLAKVGDAFAGVIRDWKDLGGKPGPITLYARDDESATYETFRAIAMGNRPIDPAAKRFASSDELADAVAADPTALGFVGSGHKRQSRWLPVSEGGGPPTYPSELTAGTGDYPIMRRLYLYTPERAKSAALDLVSFATSLEGQKVVAKAGFLDLAVRVRDEAGCRGQCPPRLVAKTKSLYRTSTTFSFSAGSADLGARARGEIDRFVSYLRDAGKPKVTLLGFADGKEPNGDKLSLQRAKRVEEELRAHGVVPQSVDAFGDDAPIGSNATESGRDRNRRVEVWIAKN